MKLYIEKINEELKNIFKKENLDDIEVKLSESNRPELSDYQLNTAFQISKIKKISPMESAEYILNLVKDMTIDNIKVFSKAETCQPGFINLSISDDILSREVEDVMNDENLGVQEVNDNVDTILLDYGGANIAKPLHIGHLRVAVIGESYKRICKKVGKKTIGDVHLGDFGLPMGLVVEELKDEGIQDSFTIDDLQVVYPKANNRMKGIKNEDGSWKVEPDNDFNERAHKATNNLQNEVEPDYSIWKRIMEISIEDLKERYKSLNVDFDYYFGESTVKDLLEPMVNDFIKKGICHESNGAYIVDVKFPTDKKEMPPCIVKKTDGSVLYATTDLGTILYREKNFKAEKYIYVVDKRQSLHFEQVFRTARLTNIVDDKKVFFHIAVGTMNGADGKPFKSRDGGVLKLETLVNDCIEKAKANVLENNKDIDNIDETARMIAMAAIKYGDLSNQPTRDYIFDIDKFLSFQGNTGPYILYTIVRIKSIFEKLGIDIDNKKNILNGLENNFFKEKDTPKIIHDIILCLTKYNDSVSKAYTSYDPSIICKYIYELSDKFNTFYHDFNISQETDNNKKSYLIALSFAVKSVLEDAISLLGIECPDKM